MSCPCDRPAIYVSDINEKLIGKIQLPSFGPFCLKVGKNECPLVELEIYDN